VCFLCELILSILTWYESLVWLDSLTGRPGEYCVREEKSFLAAVEKGHRSCKFVKIYQLCEGAIIKRKSGSHDFAWEVEEPKSECMSPANDTLDVWRVLEDCLRFGLP
jgi:hypothetical protein